MVMVNYAMWMSVAFTGQTGRLICIRLSVHGFLLKRRIVDFCNESDRHVEFFNI